MTPDSADGWYEAGRAALLRSFASDSHRELVADVEEGLAALDRAVALDPGHVPSLVDRALVDAPDLRLADA
ncbi:MAG TPA: hypothetical protein PKA64_26980, partial [Myxococcota bacterium]|nr:hypothetical protein [Myxococcota bacterium]